MKPCYGSAPHIIEQAIQLGVLCRPIHSNRVGVGEALEATVDSFWRIDHEGRWEAFNVAPCELLMDWELTTKDLIRQEWNKACETF